MPTPGQPVLQLRVSLDDVEPTVWRQLLVPGSARLDKLHRMVQAAMGWTDSHLHCFEIAGARFGMQLDDYPEDEQDEKAVTAMRAFDGVDRRDMTEPDHVVNAAERRELAVAENGAVVRLWRECRVDAAELVNGF